MLYHHIGNFCLLHLILYSLFLRFFFVFFLCSFWFWWRISSSVSSSFNQLLLPTKCHAQSQLLRVEWEPIFMELYFEEHHGIKGTIFYHTLGQRQFLFMSPPEQWDCRKELGMYFQYPISTSSNTAAFSLEMVPAF